MAASNYLSVELRSRTATQLLSRDDSTRAGSRWHLFPISAAFGFRSEEQNAGSNFQDKNELARNFRPIMNSLQKIFSSKNLASSVSFSSAATSFSRVVSKNKFVMPSRPSKSINCVPRNTSALALSHPERRQLGADGFVAAGVQSSQQLVLRAKKYVDSISEPLQKYMFMQHLQTIDPPLYVQLLMDYTTEMCPLVYTPTVGLACQRWSDIYFSPQGRTLLSRNRFL